MYVYCFSSIMINDTMLYYIMFNGIFFFCSLIKYFPFPRYNVKNNVFWNFNTGI